MNEKLPFNARIIIPAAIAVWLIGIFVFKNDTPDWLKITAAFVLFFSIIGLVGFLFLRQSGWRKLVRKFPLTHPFNGQLRTCQTVVIDSISVADPNYTKPKVRLNFIVKVGSDEEALYLSTIKIFRALLPTIRIPWTAIVESKYFNPTGWTTAPSSPGSLINIRYDPGYKGEFLEIEIEEPKIFLQLPAELLKDAFPNIKIANG